eukprot:797366-Amorphochlora_amoeboformis.AAC.1
MDGTQAIPEPTEPMGPGGRKEASECRTQVSLTILIRRNSNGVELITTDYLTGTILQTYRFAK